jgi:benzoyl-CoA reductase/2-hydroxyglutaryl-CoA dehydratase subunit BcrC/BadD/HgdB
MSAPLKSLAEMKRLTTPFPEGTAAKEWKAGGGRIVGYTGLAVPEEIIHAARMLPFRISADNEPVSLRKADACMLPSTSPAERALLQMALDGRYDFLDGVVVSVVNEGARRLVDNWRVYAPRPYMDAIFLPRKRTDEAHALYLADLEDWRNRLSEVRGAYIVDRDVKRAIEACNRGRELLQTLYALRRRDRPPVTGAEMLEVVKAATRMPREKFNDLLAQLLAEIESTGREIGKSRRLMVIGSELQNSTWIEALEEFDAVVVTDELCTGTRYCCGMVDTSLPPMEALARHYLLARSPGETVRPAGKRFRHVFTMAGQYKVDGVVSQIQRDDAEYGHDRMILKKEMEERGIPILELDVDFGDGRSEQLTTRFEAFMEVLKRRAGARASRPGGMRVRRRTGSARVASPALDYPQGDER